MMSMTISQLANAADVGVETVRFYERKGLVEQPPRPDGGGYRLYKGETVDRIRFIREAQHLGFSLADIGDLLSLQTDPSTDCGHVRARAQDKWDEVVSKIDRLEQIRDALQQLIDACPGRGNTNECTILKALSGSLCGSNGTSNGR